MMQKFKMFLWIITLICVTYFICDEFNLDTKDRTIIEAYLKATETERENIKNFLLSIAENLQKKGRWIKEEIEKFYFARCHRSYLVNVIYVKEYVQGKELVLKNAEIIPTTESYDEGNMFTAIPESIVDVLCDEFNLDTKDRTIIEAYLKATETFVMPILFPNASWLKFRDLRISLTLSLLAILPSFLRNLL